MSEGKQSPVQHRSSVVDGKGTPEVSLLAILRRLPGARALKREIVKALRRILLGDVGFDALFPMFAPNSAGSRAQKAELTINTINEVFPALCRLRQSVGGEVAEFLSVEDFCKSESQRLAAGRLKVLFDEHGSDKASYHDYHYFYASILDEVDKVSAVLEIGLGTNNVGVVSHMGERGRPGASLRAFRDYLPNALIYGADIDRKILFREERISTVFVDQTRPSAFAELRAIDARFDLIIDDGLHSPDANANTLAFALGKLKPGGWCVIEDITPAAAPVWQIVGVLLPETYSATLLHADGGMLFAVQRLP
jgi:hypothetical protein